MKGCSSNGVAYRNCNKNRRLNFPIKCMNDAKSKGTYISSTAILTKSPFFLNLIFKRARSIAGKGYLYSSTIKLLCSTGLHKPRRRCRIEILPGISMINRPLIACRSELIMIHNPQYHTKFIFSEIRIQSNSLFLPGKCLPGPNKNKHKYLMDALRCS